jgi:hypothetical protein
VLPQVSGISASLKSPNRTEVTFFYKVRAKFPEVSRCTVCLYCFKEQIQPKLIFFVPKFPPVWRFLVFSFFLGKIQAYVVKKLSVFLGGDLIDRASVSPPSRRWSSGQCASDVWTTIKSVTFVTTLMSVVVVTVVLNSWSSWLLLRQLSSPLLSKYQSAGRVKQQFVF